MTPWQTPEMERAHTNPLEKAICPLLPRSADLFILKPFFCKFDLVYCRQAVQHKKTISDQTSVCTDGR